MSEPYRRADVVAAGEPPFGAYAPKGLPALLRAASHVPPMHRGLLRRRMANLIRRLSPRGIVDVRFRGAAFRLRGGDANLIEDAILVHPRYNAREIDFLLAGTPQGGVFVDLGANVGLYTLPLALKAGPVGHVLAVDANPDIATVLDFNARASGLKNVAIACVAVGDHDGRARLEIRKDDLAIVEIVEDPAGDIEVKTLATILTEAGLARIDTLKADIEGYEDRAILPWLEGCAADDRPRRIVIEHLGRAHWRNDCFAAFARHGYREVARTRGNALFLLDR